MNFLTSAQAGAQLISLVVFASIARWYVAPWLNGRARADALIALLWVHVFRYVALQVFAAQVEGVPISHQGALDIVVGDVAGAVMAYFAILLLRRHSRLALPLIWLLALETVYDTVTNIHGGITEHLMGAARGVTWMILVFFVPLVIVSLGLIVWQLLSRRNEALDGRSSETVRAHRNTALRPS